MEYINVKISELIPYENNARMNDDAVGPVAESMRQLGYITPIIIDEDKVVLAGHTRLRAAKVLGYDKVDCIVVPGLTDEQKRKFRILDNKTAEEADWDVDLLRGELEGLNLGGITWFDDLLNPAVADISDTREKVEKATVSVDADEVVCPRCGARVSNLPFSEDEDDEVVRWSNESEE